MRRLGLIHGDDRVRDLYETVLTGRGFAVVTYSALPSPAPDAVLDCDLVVIHVPDGAEGLASLSSLDPDVPTIAIDDDPDPVRDRWLTTRGIDRVMHGPIRLRDLVDTIEQVLAEAGPVRPSTEQTTAEVVHDSHQRAVGPMDVRGDVSHAGRHLLLEASGCRIALHVFPRDVRLRLIGTVFGPDEPILARVEVDHGGAVSRTRTDRSGRFELHGLAPGDARLRIDGRGWSVDATVPLVTT